MQRLTSRLLGARAAVPDPTVTAEFLTAALELHRRDLPDRIVLSAGGIRGLDAPAGTLELVEGPAATLRELAFQLRPSTSAEAAAAVLADAGHAPEVAGRDGHAVVTVADPDGVAVVLTEGVDDVGELPPSAIRPRRIGHVNLAVPDAIGACAFYTDVLGFALSEQIGDRLTFLRTSPDHHNLGFRGGADRADVHHIALEIAGWESFRLVCDRIADLGHVVEYGPGRHAPGNNLFVYLRDPHSGLRIELFADMYAILDEDRYEPKIWESADRVRTVNRWGPQPPESFLA